MLFPTHLVAAAVLGRRWGLSVPPLELFGQYL
jgi:hypothetical protein